MKLFWIRKIRMQGSFFVFIFTISNICTKIQIGTNVLFEKYGMRYVRWNSLLYMKKEKQYKKN